MTPRLFGLALLVHLIAWCGCIAQQWGDGQPAPPPHQFGVIDEDGFHAVEMPQRGPKAAE